MGQLGHLGPIDPQLGGLPALGVSQALNSIASLSERYPRSAEMFAKYLNAALTVEQIGYCERISESAQQYAERLLMRKSGVTEDRVKAIATRLVHVYKDHGFIIDIDEAKELLGSDWVKTGTEEALAAELLYGLFDHVNISLRIHRKKRMWLIGEIEPDYVAVVDE